MNIRLNGLAPSKFLEGTVLYVAGSRGVLNGKLRNKKQKSLMPCPGGVLVH
jgi:hypothetical protein